MKRWKLETIHQRVNVVANDVHLDRRRSKEMTSAGIVEACPRSLPYASPVVRVNQNEHCPSDKNVLFENN